MTEYLQILAQGKSLSAEQAADAMHQIMQGKADPIQIAGLLMGMRARGESIEELTAFVRVMRTYFVPVACEDPHAIDVCGTGGDGTHTFNISTAAALVCAGAGVTVAKHGNRSVSSKSGSADVLEALGVNVNLNADEVASCLKEVGIGFIFARHYHPAMRHVMPVRTTLRSRTAFNILGPLCNPANVKRQVIGAFDLETAQVIAAIMHELGAEHIITLHSEDGLDEVSISAPTVLIEYRRTDQGPRKTRIEPESYGLKKADLSSLTGGDAKENATMIRSVLLGDPGPCRDVVILNSALGLWVSGRYSGMEDCVEAARASIDSGAAHERLQMLCAINN
ncbi:MAG: anthranilate phosphoribosyltransferase [Bacteroidetes bacterium]|nr:anthranilate phosphoribosyltransferase [Bacteroidota bacterium]MCY3595779.1 anthranilate phosphoribosyltransferase [Bacteroidota bacterium]